MIDTQLAIQHAEKLLEGRKLGGVTSESAKAAIQNVAETVAQEADKELTDTKTQLFKAEESIGKANYAVQQAQIENNRLTAQNEKLLAQNTKLQEDLDKQTAPKPCKPERLPNGNLSTTKIYSNGMSKTVETLPDGESVVSYKLKTVNGDIKKTKVDPVTKKRISTYTRHLDKDNNPIESMVYYTPNGYKIEKLTPKKPQTKPTVVSIEEVKTELGQKTFKETFSDGSYKLSTFYIKRPKKPFKTETYDRNDVLIENFQEVNLKNDLYTNRNEELVEYRTKKFGGNKTFPTESESVIVSRKDGEETFVKAIHGKYSDFNEIERTTTFPDGMKQIIKADQNKFGMYDTKNPSIEYIYPKTSKIKKSKLIFSDRSPVHEYILLRDGTKITTNINSADYSTTQLSITPKHGDTKLLKNKEAGDYIKDIERYVDSIGFEEYYCNYLTNLPH